MHNRPDEKQNSLSRGFGSMMLLVLSIVCFIVLLMVVVAATRLLVGLTL